MSIDPEELDLLVDGELPEVRRKRLLLDCEQIPGGWRACALAFLEAQCWRRELRSLAEAAREAPAAAPGKTVRLAATSPSRRSAWRRHGTTMLAMAASFLATMFAVGLIRMQGHSGDGPRSTEFAIDTPRANDGAPSASPSPAPRFRPETSRDESVLADASPAGGSAPGAPVRWVKVSMPGDDPQSDRELLLPAIEASHFNDGLLSPAASAGVDPRLEALVRQHGMEIQRQRHMMPLHTDEGRDIVVPVSRYEIRRRDADDIQ